jgi:hypothetical protein
MRERSLLSPADSKAVVYIRLREPLYGMCVWERKEVDILRQRACVCEDVEVRDDG